MQLQETYDKLENLDKEEQIGFQYFQKTGEYLDYLYLCYLKTLEDPYNFNALQGDEARQYRADLISRLENDPFGILTEKIFIADEVNTEIQYVPRYLDIFAHSHDFFEIVCTLKGKCMHLVEGTTVWMQQGDITVIPPNVKHYLRAEPESVTLTIKTRKTTFDSAFSSLLRSGTVLSAYFAQTLYSTHYKNSLTFHCKQDTFIAELLFYMLIQENERKNHYGNVIDGLVTAFFSYLVQNYEETAEFSSGDNANNERIIEIENYIRQNYKTSTLTSVAHHFYLNPSYLSTIIKKQTGYTFSSILHQIRMEHAAQLLADTNLKVDQVCENVGYHDTTQFIKSFKKFYGTTPLRYRNTFISEKSVKGF